mgnify:CR=1 FL=1
MKGEPKDARAALQAAAEARIDAILAGPGARAGVHQGAVVALDAATGALTRLCGVNDTLLDLVEKKLVEPKEAWMKSVDKSAFIAALKAKGHDTSFNDDPASGGTPAGGTSKPTGSAPTVRR